jgi:hypothetical protein
MFNATRLRRSAFLGALACALLGASTGAVAAAHPHDDARIAAALAQERYYDPVPQQESTTTAVAVAQPNNDAHCRVQLGAGLGLVPCYHDPDPQHKSTRAPSDNSPRLTAAHAQERYYSSYGELAPLTLAQSPAPPDGTPWLTIALAAAVALVAASIAAIHRRRLRLRRGVAGATT